jgi:predicted secreted hydrolase
MNKPFRLCLILVLCLGLLSGCLPAQTSIPAQGETIEWVKASENMNSFAKADSERSFSFPADHGAHPEYQTEWWYFTGNLISEDGKEFGYQLTFFRRSLSANPTERDSTWASKNIYMAHFTLTDVQGNQFYPTQRFSRDGNRLAGAETKPYASIWLEGWSARQVDDSHWELQAKNQDQSIELTLNDLTGPVLQGESGLSRKSAESASYYYSLPRMTSNGTIQIGKNHFAVKGISWMDHEFSTSVLTRDQIGWDWFGLQLSDGTEIMLFTLRREDGSLDSFSSLCLIDSSGKVINYPLDEWKVTSQGGWKSPHSDGVYPAGWVIVIPEAQLELTVTPRIADQELNLSFVYWEGAVKVEGQRAGNAISGQGYVELTGYAHPMGGL